MTHEVFLSEDLKTLERGSMELTFHLVAEAQTFINLLPGPVYGREIFKKSAFASQGRVSFTNKKLQLEILSGKAIFVNFLKKKCLPNTPFNSL